MKGYCSEEYCQSGLKSETTCKVVEGLNIYIANLNVLFVKLHNLHWNVVGTGFFDLHAKTGGLYEVIGEEIDKVAERIKMLGSYPIASLRESLKFTTIDELPSEQVTSSCVARIIVDDFCEMLQLVRKIDSVAKETLDECTVGLLANSMCFFEKNIWFFSSYLTKCRD